MVQLVLSVWALFCSPLSAVISCSSYCVKPLLSTEHIPCVKSTHFVYNFLSKVNENIGGFLMCVSLLQHVEVRVQGVRFGLVVIQQLNLESKREMQAAIKLTGLNKT